MGMVRQPDVFLKAGMQACITLKRLAFQGRTLSPGMEVREASGNFDNSVGSRQSSWVVDCASQGP